MEKESLELLLGHGISVEQIAKRFRKDPSTVTYWMRKYGLEAPNREKCAAKGGIGRERLEELVEAGLSIAEIAATVERSKATVKHWLSRFGLRTKSARGLPTAATEIGKRAGRLTIRKSCPRHGETAFTLEGRGYYRCKRCRSERVAERRRKVKATLAAEAGGRCRICGYDRYIGALEFHHLDPAEKRLGLSYKGVALAIATLREEARKCVLLCANCHAEVEAGLAVVPIE